MKEVYPVQTAEYAVQPRLSQDPAFAWWVSFVLKKQNRIIAKFKSKYWIRTHKFGILIFCNHAPIIWNSKRHNTVETSKFGSEFTGMKNSINLSETLRYKL